MFKIKDKYLKSEIADENELAKEFILSQFNLHHWRQIEFDISLDLEIKKDALKVLDQLIKEGEVVTNTSVSMNIPMYKLAGSCDTQTKKKESEMSKELNDMTQKILDIIKERSNKITGWVALDVGYFSEKAGMSSYDVTKTLECLEKSGRITVRSGKYGPTYYQAVIMLLPFNSVDNDELSHRKAIKSVLENHYKNEDISIYNDILEAVDNASKNEFTHEEMMEISYSSCTASDTPLEALFDMYTTCKHHND